MLEHHNHVHITVACAMCVNVHTNKINIYSLKWLDYFQKNSSYARLSLLDSRHRCENPMVLDALWSLSRFLTQYAEAYKVSYTLNKYAFLHTVFFVIHDQGGPFLHTVFFVIHELGGH